MWFILLSVKPTVCSFYIVLMLGNMLGNIYCRRTYIGSMPGRILNALKTVGVKNPVILLDEVDKMVIFTAYNYFFLDTWCYR